MAGTEKTSEIKVLTVGSRGKRVALGVASFAAFAVVCALLICGAPKGAVVLAVAGAITVFTALCIESDMVETLESLGEQMMAAPSRTGAANLAGVLKVRKALRISMAGTLFFLVMLILFGCGELVPTWSLQWTAACVATAMLLFKIDDARNNVRCKFVPEDEG